MALETRRAAERTPPRSSRSRLRLLRLGFGLLVALFWGILIARNWGELSTREWSLDVGWTAAALLAFALYFLGLGVGWTLVARAMGYRLPAGSGLGVWLLSMPARYVPGNVWHIAARVRLAGEHRVPAEGVVASSAVEQALTVLSAACLGLAWLPSLAGPGWAAPAAAFLVACLLALQPPVVRLLLNAAAKLLGRPAPPFALGYRRMVSLLVWYGLVNAANGAAFFLLVSATSHLPETLAPALGSAYCLAYVIGYVSFLTPSGVGVREAALASMLSLYMPLSGAITLSLLARLLSTAGEAAAVLLVGLPLATRGERPA